MPEYYTYKKDADAAATPGQTVKFTTGKGYYITGTPAPSASAPNEISDVASGGGYSSTTKTASPAAKQPTAAVSAPPPQISDVASGAGYGTTTSSKQPVAPPTSPGTTTATPVDRPTAPPSTLLPSQPGPSDARSSGGYGSRYYTYKKDAEAALKPGQKVGFTTGKGYYLYYPVIAAVPSPAPRVPISPMPPAVPPGGGGGGGTRSPAVGAGIANGPKQADPTGQHPGTKAPPLGPRPTGVPTGWESAAARSAAKTAYDYFIGKGLKPVQAAALVGNFLVESGYGLNPRADNGIGNHGIGQWGTSVASGQRWQQLETWAAGRRLNVYSLQTQLDFVWHEMTTTYSSFRTSLKQITNLSNIDQASDLVTRAYEGAIAGSGLQEPSQREYESRLVLATFLGT